MNLIRLFIESEEKNKASNDITKYNHNKIVLFECISCYITETTEGIFDLDLVYPLNDEKKISQYLVRGNIIKSPISQTDSRGEQLFTIRKRIESIKDNRVTIYAQAKARRDLDLNMVLGLHVPAGQTRKQACQLLLSKCVEQQSYTIGNLDTNTNTGINLGLEEDTGNIINYLDISGISARKAFLDDSENSIYKAYGGEIIYNNFEINVVDERGIDNTITISDGKNLEELQRDIDDMDTDNFATAILPCSSDGVYLPNSEIIYSPNAATLGKVFKRIVYDDVTLVNDTAEALNVVYAQLRERVQKDFDNGLDKLNINNTINFIQLANTEQYKNYSQLEKCEIGNNVIVNYYKADLTATGRVIKIKYNVLRNKIEEVEVGERKSNIANAITNNQNNTYKNSNNIRNIIKTTKNLKVVMEARDSEIELSVTNLATDTSSKFLITDRAITERVTNTDFTAYKITTADTIAQKVNSSEFGSLIEQHADNVEIAVKSVTDNLQSQINVSATAITERVTNTDFNAYKSTTAEAITQKISKGTDFSSELRQNVDAFQFLFNDASNGKTEITIDGVTVYDGAFTVKDDSGSTVLRFNSDGSAYIRDLQIGDTSPGSWFHNALVNMDEITTGEIKPSRLTIDEDEFYIENGYTLTGWIEKVVLNMKSNGYI